MFQLKDRLKRINSYQTHDALFADTPIAEDQAGALEGSGVGDDCEVQIDEEGNECDGKSLVGNRKVRARFGRRRTHNEELCVASCGIVLRRMTFYGSESPTNVRVRICFYLLSFKYPNHPCRSSSCVYSLRTNPSLVLFGTTTIARFTQCSATAKILKSGTTSMSASFLSTSFISRRNTRSPTITATRTATPHNGQNYGKGRTVRSGGLIRPPLSKSTLGLVGTKQSCGRCRLTGTTFSLMKWCTGVMSGWRPSSSELVMHQGGFLDMI